MAGIPQSALNQNENKDAVLHRIKNIRDPLLYVRTDKRMHEKRGQRQNMCQQKPDNLLKIYRFLTFLPQGMG